MKIVLVHLKENFTPLPPLGILYVGTMLKKEGHEVSVFDENIKESKVLLQIIKEIDPDVVGFSAMTTSYTITRKFNEQLKLAVPSAYYCWGGVHASALPIETIEENNLDFLVYGEGEFTMTDVCKVIKGKKTNAEKRGFDLKGIPGVYYVNENKIVKNPARPAIEDLDSVPIPDRSLLRNFEWYLFPPGILRGKFYHGITIMYATRGCSYKCIFCASRIVHGEHVRIRSVQNVIEEMEYLKKDFGVTGIYFHDDTFATDIGWLKELCDTIKKKKLNMIWGCQTRANIAQDIDVLRIMKDAGCVQVDIGCESGSDKILKNLRKGISRKMIVESFKNLKKLKMETFATFIVGNPGETMEDIKKTEEVAKMAPGAVSFLILVPYPGSPLYKMALEHNWFIDSNVIFDERWTNKQSNIPVMQASFKAKELVKIRASLQNKFFLRNNLPTIIAFLKSPFFLYKAVEMVFLHPFFVAKSFIKAIRKRKSMDFLEDLYQKFNERLKNQKIKRIKI
jgi:anaerobic magnesium-protoporphyrin IX monomethyl ester cyclase